MLQIVKTAQFEKWLKRIKDTHARSIIEARIGKIAFRGELCGDWKNLGEDLFEMRFFIGPGYRVYFSLRGGALLLLLLGGNHDFASNNDNDHQKNQADENHQITDNSNQTCSTDIEVDHFRVY